MGRPWKVLLVDDHPVVRDGLAQRIELEPDLTVCATCDSVSVALKAAEAHHPDLAVVDLALPNGHGLDLIKELHTRHPAMRLLVFSMHDEQTYGERALLSGAQGYVMKDESPDRVLEAIRNVLAGKISINPNLSSQLLQAAMGGRRRDARKEADGALEQPRTGGPRMDRPWAEREDHRGAPATQHQDDRDPPPALEGKTAHQVELRADRASGLLGAGEQWPRAAPSQARAPGDENRE